MKVLIDTNVIVDWLTGREPYFKNADLIMQWCRDKKIIGYMAAHSVSNIFYILRKDYDVQTRRKMIKNLFYILTVSGIDENKLLSALDKDYFYDFEDCLQDECAVSECADYIVTRNIKDFSSSRVKAVLPEDIIRAFDRQF